MSDVTYLLHVLDVFSLGW